MDPANDEAATAERFSVAEVVAIHRRLMEGAPNAHIADHIRTTQMLPPIVQAALVHARFETIHPFDDGDGRTGRALIRVVLRRRGVAPSYVPPISVALAADRDRYIAGLADFREDRLDAWLEQFASAAARAARLASACLVVVAELTEGWRAAVSARPNAPRADAAV